MKRKQGYLTLEGFMARFSAGERAEIEANASRLAAETVTVAKLRKARRLTQVELAQRLGIAQENISRLEKRSDMLVSTLRGYVRAMGGDLRLVALFPGKDALEVDFHDPQDADEAEPKTRSSASRAARRKPASSTSPRVTEGSRGAGPRRLRSGAKT